MSCSKTLCKMFLDLFLKNCLEISSKTLKHIMYLQNCNHTFFVTVLWCNENLKILTKTEMIGNRKEMKKKNFGRSKVYKMYIYWKKRKYWNRKKYRALFCCTIQVCCTLLFLPECCLTPHAYNMYIIVKVRMHFL